MLKLIFIALFIILCLFVISIFGIYYICKILFKDFTIDYDFDENEEWM